MKQCTICLISKENTEFYKSRVTLSRQCKLCTKDKLNKKRSENRDVYNKKQREWRAANPERSKELGKRFRDNHPGYCNKYKKEWRKKNSGYRKHEKAMRRASEKQATPKWLTKDHKKEMLNFYKNCPKGFHVDHIIPINGKDVKGLHVPWNLQYLPAIENLKKSNKVTRLS